MLAPRRPLSAALGRWAAPAIAIAARGGGRAGPRARTLPTAAPFSSPTVLLPLSPRRRAHVVDDDGVLRKCGAPPARGAKTSSKGSSSKGRKAAAATTKEKTPTFFKVRRLTWWGQLDPVGVEYRSMLMLIHTLHHAGGGRLRPRLLGPARGRGLRGGGGDGPRHRPARHPPGAFRWDSSSHAPATLVLGDGSASAAEDGCPLFRAALAVDRSGGPSHACPTGVRHLISSHLTAQLQGEVIDIPYELTISPSLRDFWQVDY